VLVALVAPSPATAVIAILMVAADIALRFAELWIVLGASPERLMDRGALVLRGMTFAFDARAGRSLEERHGRIRVSILASPIRRAHLLRVRTTRGINKVALFRTNFGKFLVAIPRERR
jgi:hypothetical protein